MAKKKVVWNEQTQETPEPSADEYVSGEKEEYEKIMDVNDDKILTSTEAELDKSPKDFGLSVNLGNLRHKECYCVMSGKDNIVMAFIPDAFDPKFRGKIFQVIGEAGLSMENATTLSASVLFDKQVRPEEKPDPQKPLFKE